MWLPRTDNCDQAQIVINQVTSNHMKTWASLTWVTRDRLRGANAAVQLPCPRASSHCTIPALPRLQP